MGSDWAVEEGKEEETGEDRRRGKERKNKKGTVSRCIYAGVSRVQRDMRLQVAGKGRREASR